MSSNTATGRTVAPIRWYWEITAVVAFYGAYLLTRGMVTVDIDAAAANGHDILRFQQALGLDFESPLNRIFTALPAVGLVSAFLYATLHYLVTPIVLASTLRRPDHYRLARNALAIATGLGLVGYILFPAAPPRLLDANFTDTMAQWSGIGWWGDAASAPQGMEGFSNQYAAMPSLHVGWAVWVALVLDRPTMRTLTRTIIWSYPTVMALIVMGTANHYLLDALAGTAVAVVGHRLARRMGAARPAFRSEPLPVPCPTGASIVPPVRSMVGVGSGPMSAVGVPDIGWQPFGRLGREQYQVKNACTE